MTRHRHRHHESPSSDHSAAGPAGANPPAVTPDPAPWKAALLLILLALLAFGPFVRAPLFWDDLIVISADGPISRPETFARIFTGRMVLFPDTITYDYFRPVSDLLLYIQFQVAGTRPLPYHLAGFLLHLSNILIAFTLFRSVTRTCPRSPLAASLGAGIFGLHPVQVECVLWPTAQNALAATLFCGLALLCVRRLVLENEMSRGNRILLTILSVMLFTLGMLAKESAVVFPAAAVPLLLRYNRRDLRPALSVILLCWAFILVHLVVNSLAGVRAGGAMLTAPGERVPMLLQGLGFYLRKVLWPIALHPSYGQDSYRTPLNLALGAGVLLILLGAAAWQASRRAPRGTLLAAAILLALGGAVLPFVGGVIDVADRYLYHSLWGIGLAACLVYTGWNPTRPVSWKSPAVLAVPALLLVLSLVSLRQSVRWTDDAGLWRHAHACDPLNPMSAFHIAKTHERALETDEAIDWYLRTIALPFPEPTKEQVRAACHALNLLVYRKDYARAAALYPLASRDPEYGAESRVWAAMALLSLGRREEGLRLYMEFEDDGRRPADVYRNLALIARHFADDPEGAARWEEKARAAGPRP